MDIITPSINTLLDQVDSKYSLVVLASKRARQLLDGEELKVQAHSTKDVTNALEEIATGKIIYTRTKESIK